MRQMLEPSSPHVPFLHGIHEAEEGESVGSRGQVAPYPRGG